MDEKDDKSAEDNPEPRISQIPLLSEIVFDPALPLRTPTRTKRPIRRQVENDHGPDYDPDTLDLFEDPATRLHSFIKKYTEEELRAGADRVIEDIVQEYTAEITSRLRDELKDQLGAILDDLNVRPKEE